jgi:hypothetical protein
VQRRAVSLDDDVLGPYVQCITCENKGRYAGEKLVASGGPMVRTCSYRPIRCHTRAPGPGSSSAGP